MTSPIDQPGPAGTPKLQDFNPTAVISHTTVLADRNLKASKLPEPTHPSEGDLMGTTDRLKINV
jgi:hypothetical protein